MFLKENDMKSAVSTFLACGLWQNVVGLYQDRGLFADAHQVITYSKLFIEFLINLYN